MLSRLTPAIARGITNRELTITFGPSGSALRHDVVVPVATRVRQLQGGQSPCWVVEDLNFLTDRRSVAHHDAEHYGIPVPDEAVTTIPPGDDRACSTG